MNNSNQIEINNLASLIRDLDENKNNDNKVWNLFNISIMNDFTNLPYNLIQNLGNSSYIYKKEIDLYNNKVFSINYNNKYFIIIPDSETYENDDKKLLIVVLYNSLNEYNKAIKEYYSQFN